MEETFHAVVGNIYGQFADCLAHLRIVLSRLSGEHVQHDGGMEGNGGHTGGDHSPHPVISFLLFPDPVAQRAMYIGEVGQILVGGNVRAILRSPEAVFLPPFP